MIKILDFYAEWCQPCKQMKPVIDSLDKDFSVEKINIDEDPETSQAHGVMSIPTLIVMNGDEEVKRYTGVTSENDIRGLIAQLG